MRAAAIGRRHLGEGGVPAPVTRQTEDRVALLLGRQHTNRTASPNPPEPSTQGLGSATPHGAILLSVTPQPLAFLVEYVTYGPKLGTTELHGCRCVEPQLEAA
jgi:hypothetical protein